MATILPFHAVRPTIDKAHLVASRSVDGYNVQQLRAKLAENPFTFLHVINPDFADGQKTRPGSPERLRKTKKRYLEFLFEGVMERDSKRGYYVYRQFKDNNIYTGIIGCTSIDDYLGGVIKIHEQTLQQREEKLKAYLEVCDFNAEPVLFSYPDDEIINREVAEATSHRAEYDFTTTDRVRHQLWIISDEEKTEIIRKRFEAQPAVYIADGHHRSASSSLLGQERREKNPKYSGNEGWNYYLGIFFPESQLRIYDFNRVVKDLNSLSDEQFLEQLAEKFVIEKKGTDPYKATKLHNMSMYLSGNWYSITLKPEFTHDSDPVGSLDAALLSEHVLSPILGIHDLRTDKRAGFVSGIKGMEELKNQVDNWKFRVAFGLFPVTMNQLKRIADTNNIMPPKSTWVEPKMRSGLVIYSLDDEL